MAGAAARAGLGELGAVLRALPRRPALLRFLVARLFYTDGLNTLFAFGAIYAAGVFGMVLYLLVGGLGDFFDGNTIQE